MKKMMFMIALLLGVAATGFADDIVLVNQTSYPNQKQNSKIAIQWAYTAQEVEAGNQAMIYGNKLDSSTLHVLTQSGKVKVNVPQKAEYFRVLAWSSGQGSPDLLTNWVQIVPNKSYTLKSDHLVPTVLMAGSGC